MFVKRCLAGRHRPRMTLRPILHRRSVPVSSWTTRRPNSRFWLDVSCPFYFFAQSFTRSSSGSTGSDSCSRSFALLLYVVAHVPLLLLSEFAALFLSTSVFPLPFSFKFLPRYDIQRPFFSRLLMCCLFRAVFRGRNNQCEL